jgi:hypothetical protein
MFRLLLISILFAQIPVKPSEGGTITGILKDADGNPVVGVRIAAVARPDAAVDLDAVAIMSSLGETDSEGKFRLDTVPPGRYYIAAGRVDLPTYYPGTQLMANGELIQIEPGSTITLGGFVLIDESIRTPTGNDVVYRSIPVQIRVENGARLPIYSSTGQTLLWLTRSDNTRTGLQMTGTSIRLPIPSTTVAGEFRAAIANLPEGYAVKAVMFGPDNVTSSAFKVAAGASAGPLLSVELTTVPVQATTGKGVRVTGYIPNGFSVYLSGMPANLYSDGTFEFRNVPPGRHAIAVPDTATMSSTLAASVVVGDRDIEGVRLVETPVLPFAPRAPAQPGPAGNHPAGTTVPLASLRGRVLEESSNRPLAEGTAILTSFTKASYPIGANGEFVVPSLFPGNYNLQIQVSGRTPINRKVTIGDEDVNLELIVGAM